MLTSCLSLPACCNKALSLSFMLQKCDAVHKQEKYIGRVFGKSEVNLKAQCPESNVGSWALDIYNLRRVKPAARHEGPAEFGKPRVLWLVATQHNASSAAVPPWLTPLLSFLTAVFFHLGKMSFLFFVFSPLNFEPYSETFVISAFWRLPSFSKKTLWSHVELSNLVCFWNSLSKHTRVELVTDYMTDRRMAFVRTLTLTLRDGAVVSPPLGAAVGAFQCSFLALHSRGAVRLLWEQTQRTQTPHLHHFVDLTHTRLQSGYLMCDLKGSNRSTIRGRGRRAGVCVVCVCACVCVCVHVHVWESLEVKEKWEGGGGTNSHS